MEFMTRTRSRTVVVEGIAIMLAPSSSTVMSVLCSVRVSPPLRGPGCTTFGSSFTVTVRPPCATATELMRTLPRDRPPPRTAG